MGKQVLVRRYALSAFEDGINAMLTDGYGLHSWRITGGIDPFVCIFVKMQGVPEKPTGIKAR